MSAHQRKQFMLMDAALLLTLNLLSGCASICPAFAPTLSLAELSPVKSNAAMASSILFALKLLNASSNPPTGAFVTGVAFPLPPAPAFFLSPALGAFVLTSGRLASSSLLSRSSSAFFAAAAAAFSAFSSALLRPLAPWSHLADSASSAFAFAAAFLALAVSSLRARPAAALLLAVGGEGEEGGACE